MIPVSVSEIRSWHAQHRDEGDWRWCAIDRLLGDLRDVASSGVEFEDPRLSYVVVQIDRDDWRHLGEYVDREERE